MEKSNQMSLFAPIQKGVTSLCIGHFSKEMFRQLHDADSDLCREFDLVEHTRRCREILATKGKEAYRGYKRTHLHGICSQVYAEGEQRLKGKGVESDKMFVDIDNVLPEDFERCFSVGRFLGAFHAQDTGSGHGLFFSFEVGDDWKACYEYICLGFLQHSFIVDTCSQSRVAQLVVKCKASRLPDWLILNHLGQRLSASEVVQVRNTLAAISSGEYKITRYDTRYLVSEKMERYVGFVWEYFDSVAKERGHGAIYCGTFSALWRYVKQRCDELSYLLPQYSCFRAVLESFLKKTGKQVMVKIELQERMRTELDAMRRMFQEFDSCHKKPFLRRKASVVAPVKRSRGRREYTDAEKLQRASNNEFFRQRSRLKKQGANPRELKQFWIWWYHLGGAVAWRVANGLLPQ